MLAVCLISVVGSLVIVDGVIVLTLVIMKLVILIHW